MAIGGALGAVSSTDPRPTPEIGAFTMNPMIGGQAMLPDRDILENISASPLHSALVAALKRGSQLLVKGISRRGTATTDTYSLNGISAALDAAAKSCGG